MNRTPGKYHIRNGSNWMTEDVWWVIFGEQDKVGRSICTAASKEDAERIARVMNCHERLVDYCKGMLECMEGISIPSNDQCNIRDLKALLAEAKGGENEK